MSDVTLVIPARDAAHTLAQCLDSITAQSARERLAELIVVDDGSVDETPDIAHARGVRVIRGRGEGPGAARNLGWRSASTPLVWFVDADCVCDPRALELLLDALEPGFDGVGGSYTNMVPESLVATLIHEEIVTRHLKMPREVDFLATFNVLYRRDALEEVGGFDASYRVAQDAELAFRLKERGSRLLFERTSTVGHYHPTRLWPYLKKQHAHGYFRAQLYRRHPSKSSGDSYASVVDYAQIPAALLAMASAPLAPLAPALTGASLAGLLATQLPMTRAIVSRTRRPELAAFAPFGAARACSRALGFVRGVAAVALEDTLAVARREVAR